MIHLKCNVPKFEQHRAYEDDQAGLSLSMNDFWSLQSQFDARGYKTSTKITDRPLRGSIEVVVDYFTFYVELYKDMEE